ncbi:MAG: helix-hairpin-helix domain-containing protein [Chloroflexi bacterium]|nr:helix-hairpin-helix domain-containing protein [Chloroflexota bacterium]
MARARKLLWLGAFAGIAYLVWRWRREQTEKVRLSAPSHGPQAGFASYPAPTTSPHPAQPTPPTSDSPAAASGRRPIPTRVHRGAPPSPSSRPPQAPAPEPEPEPEPAAPAAQTALLAREVAASAGPEEAEAQAGEEAPPEAALANGETTPEAPAAPPQSAEAPPTAAPGAQAEPGEAVNLNTADVDTLIALPGIGPALAQRIIAYREEHGPFADIDQLLAIQGIGPRNIDEFRHLVTV